MIKKWKKVKTEETYQCGKWYSVDKDKVITPGGKQEVYYTVRRKPAVAIIPVDEKGNIHLTKQHRYAIGKFTLEVPGGYIDNKEKPISTAKKELEEEMSLRAKRWLYLGKYYEASGLADILVYVYLAKSVYKIKNAKKDTHDKNLHQTEIYTSQEVVKKIAKCEIMDSFSLSSLAIAYAKKVL